MGDNASIKKDWHNTTVGQGYQSRGVILHPTAQYSSNIIDMSKQTTPFAESEDMEHKSKKSKREKQSKHKKHKHKKEKSKHRDKDKFEKFNPFLQILALQISDTTLEFSV